MIDLSGVSLTLGGRLLYDGLSWRIGDGAKIGLVGANGSGKTTLFRMIMGLVEPDSGTVSVPSGLRLGYLPQDLFELPDMPVMACIKEKAGITVLEEALKRAEDSQDPKRHETALDAYERAGGFSFEAMVKKAMGGLGFAKGDWDLPTSRFSGGWKMRIGLASALLSRPDALLLDEPTNHLDTESMEWLEGWLLAFPGTVVGISHDRRFMDKIMGSIALLSERKITLYKGNFSKYLEESASKLEQAAREKAAQDREIERTRQFIDRFRAKATKAAQVQSRIKKLERMENLWTHVPDRTVSIRFPRCPRSGRQVLSVRDLGKTYGDSPVFEGLNFQLTRGEKAALVGVNGAGKSTLSRIIAGKEDPSRGSAALGVGVKEGFFSQESSRNLDYRNTVWQEICGASDRMTPEGKRSLLGAFLFSGDSIHKSISVLSGGEKSRVALVKLLLEETNFLVLDEPTNHLDMATKDLFQRALLEYDGTMLIVSHDRFFLDNLVTRVLEIRDGRLFDYPGNYSCFVEKRSRAGEAEERPRTCGTGQKEQKRREAQDRNRLYRERKIFMDRLGPLEARISGLETEIQAIRRELCDPVTLARSSVVQDRMVALSSREKELAEAMALWENLMEKLEAVE